MAEEHIDKLHELLDPIIAKAEAIERDKHGKALTEEEVRALQAYAFLRKIAPYLFTAEKTTLPKQLPTVGSIVGKLL